MNFVHKTVTLLLVFSTALQSVGFKKASADIPLDVIHVGEEKNDEDILSFLKFNDELEIKSMNDTHVHTKTKNVIKASQMPGFISTSTEDEEIEVVSDVQYDIGQGEMIIDMSFMQDDTLLDTITINTTIFYDEDGEIDGEFEYEGVSYSVSEVLDNYESSSLDNSFAISTAVIIGLVAGAIIGGVTGAVISYSKYNTIKWRYVVGGAVVGTFFGGAAGYGVGLMYGGTVAMSSSVASVARNPSSLKITKTVQNHLSKRPYIHNSTLVSEIIKAVKPTRDAYLNNGLKWVAPGTHNGTKGVWELVIDMNSKTIVHYLFRK